MLKKVIYFVILAIAINSFAAASFAQTGLKGKWKLVSMMEKPDMEVIPEAGLITLNIQRKSLGGNGGCNTYGGSYSVTGKRMRIKDIFSTKMACDNLHTEQTFFNSLGKTFSYSIIRGKLHLKDRGGKTILRFERAKS